MAKKINKPEKAHMQLTDRTAYLRGLADGMDIDKGKNENALMLQMLDVLDDMAHKLTDMEADLRDVEEYMEDIDADLADMEDVLFGDEDDEDDDEDFSDEGEDDFDEFEALSFDCPGCGKTVMVKASDIDFDESPVCEFCGKPFFTDADVDDDDEGEKPDSEDDE